MSNNRDKKLTHIPKKLNERKLMNQMNSYKRIEVKVEYIGNVTKALFIVFIIFLVNPYFGSKSDNRS